MQKYLTPSTKPKSVYMKKNSTPTLGQSCCEAHSLILGKSKNHLLKLDLDQGISR